MSFSADRVELARGAVTMVIVPELPRSVAGPQKRDREGRLAEVTGLANAIGVHVTAAHTIVVRTVHSATLMGKGQVSSLSDLITDLKVELVIIDSPLSPIQQRNLESAFATKVIDRTALILEIFGERAVTAEGRMQVELAHLDYQQGRLVRSWTHLERQRGGFGFLGGPGETQIEADRRLIRDRMAHIRRSLDGVKRTRSLHRQRRQRAPWPVIALVGYTNAGKSTLFNVLSQSSVTAEDMLFATLDPTMRQIMVHGLGKVILSDTVGFISELPTQLVAAFRATLEEVLSADLLLHVRDISHPESQAQRDDVLQILGDLGIGPLAHLDKSIRSDYDVVGPPIIEIHNKIDLLHDDVRADSVTIAHDLRAFLLSALTGVGVTELKEGLSTILGGQEMERKILVPIGDGSIRSWLYRNTKVLTEQAFGDEQLAFHIKLSALSNGRLTSLLEESQDTLL